MGSNQNFLILRFIFLYFLHVKNASPLQEGSSNERGLYLRSFEELFDLSNSDSTSTSRYNFYMTAFELYNEQVFYLSFSLPNKLFIYGEHLLSMVGLLVPCLGVEWMIYAYP